MPGIHDLKIEPSPQSPENEKRTQKKAQTQAGEAMALAGYQTLDQASSNEVYGEKERKGLNRDASYQRRFD